MGDFRDGVLRLDWNGTLRREGTRLHAEADHTWTRKYWYDAIGLEQYLDLVRRAVELRSRVNGDVALTHYDDDGAYVALTFPLRRMKRIFAAHTTLFAKLTTKLRKQCAKRRTR